MRRLYDALAEIVHPSIVSNGLAAELAGIDAAEVDRRVGACLLLCADIAGAADLAASLIRVGIGAPEAWKIASAGMAHVGGRTDFAPANEQEPA
ncbi:hypothetical protein [Phenylobacterium kunshanense]|uniref:Uncharacterized protein n=1 Tax=Phenylobacterium kunshanense TaxID=1445034 RepID=A0A328BNB7_9CAUL|nr:hypothetical protein [Phenylobacterium kunshanense]RAK68882.1 hypothetical protein DJ019_02385 [Phenylobacterium kunshanense]